MWQRALERLRSALRELGVVGREVGGSFQQMTRPCTCGNPRHPGPCPRHGRLG